MIYKFTAKEVADMLVDEVRKKEDIQIGENIKYRCGFNIKNEDNSYIEVEILD